MAEMSREDMLAMIEALKGQLQAAKAAQGAKLRCKVSEKGGVSVYGLGRWPITLYKSQWEAFLPFVKSGVVDEFIAANASLLSVKGE